MQLLLQIADHFETLASGKILAVGLFVDRVVVMQVPADAPDPTTETPFATDLGLLLNFNGVSAPQLRGEVRILPPEGGPPVGVLQVDDLNLNGGRSANILTRLKPLLVPRAGVYTVEAHIGDETLIASFEVRIQRLPPGPLLPQAAPRQVPAAAQSKRPRRAKP